VGQTIMQKVRTINFVSTWFVNFSRFTKINVFN